jgi:hypothetical protein
MDKRFDPGMLVVKTFHGTHGYTEYAASRIAKIEGGTVYLGDGECGYESGITYSAATGREIEMFFLSAGMWSEIRPATAGDTGVDGYERAVGDAYTPEDGE